jgi:hypothetical protein
VGDATYVEWSKMPVNSFLNSDSTVFNQVEPLIGTGIYQANVRTSWVQENAIAWGSAAGEHNGSMVYAQQSAPLATYQTQILKAGTPGQFLMMGTSGILNVPTPVWTNLPATGVTGVTGTAPIQVNNTNPLTPIVGFDVNTTALTSYIPKSAFNATSTLLVGSGVGSYNTLAPGNNGQVLSVASNGALVWVDPAPPVDPINLTPADNTITLTPNPITGTGTIGVTPDTFIQASVLTPGALIYGAPSTGVPSRLAPPVDTSSWLTSNGGTPSWRQFFANTSTTSVSLGNGAAYNGANGNTCIGAGANPTTSAGLDGTNQVVLASGNGNKMWLSSTGALGFPSAYDFPNNPRFGSSGDILVSQGTANTPQWGSPANVIGSSKIGRTALIGSNTTATIWSGGISYLKFVITVATRWPINPNPAYQRFTYIQEWELIAVANIDATVTPYTNIFTKTRDIYTTPGATNYQDVFTLTNNQSTIILTNTLYNQFQAQFQVLNYAVTFTNFNPIVTY